MELIIYILLFLICILLINIFFKYRRTKLLTLRISKYTVIENEDNISIIEVLKDLYKTIIEETSLILLRFDFFKKYSFKYTKYLRSINNKEIIQMNFVTKKIYLSFIITFMYFVICFIESYKVYLYMVIVLLIFGFYIYDILLIYRFYKRKKIIEKELINAVMLMNNSFKSGKSLMQAIKIVSEELDGAISNEFSKIYTEISYGLSVELAFQRFYKRTKADNIEYIASSLSILNKTGGNIIRVFDSIEKTLINKKQFEKEKDALTASSKILVKFLLIIPLLIVLVIYLFDNTYFKPLYTTDIGIIVILLIVISYIAYIWFIKRVLRVRV